MKVIETTYNGHRFRSRLEARTAVLMDSVCIPYIYEPEGFAFEDGTTYLPDFYLPNQDAFLECKGIMSEKDWTKIGHLAKETGKNIVIVYPDLSFTLSEWTDDLNTIYPWEPHEGGLYESESWICRCKNCHKTYFGDESAAWDCKCCGYYDGDSGFDVLCHGHNSLKRKNDPTTIALSVKFEFGKAGVR